MFGTVVDQGPHTVVHASCLQFESHMCFINVECIFKQLRYTKTHHHVNTIRNQKVITFFQASQVTVVFCKCSLILLLC